MNNLSCIIIDDEASGRIVLRELLSKFHHDVKVIGEAGNPEEGFKEISSKNPDFIFLDIQMPGGSGFELLKKFTKINFEVIFVTSYEKYAINAIKCCALDYLLKPIDIPDLEESIKKVKTIKHDKINTQPLIINLLNNIDEVNPEKKIVLHHKDKVKLVKLSDVICMEAEGNYSHVYTTEGQRYTPARLLKDFEDFLIPHENFVRINKSIIVNLEHISEYSKGDPCLLYMNNGNEYEIARRKKTEIIEKIKK